MNKKPISIAEMGFHFIPEPQPPSSAVNLQEQKIFKFLIGVRAYQTGIICQ